MYICTHIAILGALLTAVLTAPMTSPNLKWDAPLKSPSNSSTTIMDALKAKPTAAVLGSSSITKEYYTDTGTLSPPSIPSSTSPPPPTIDFLPSAWNISIADSSTTTATLTSACKPWTSPQKQSDCAAALNSLRHNHRRWELAPGQCLITHDIFRCRAYICAGCQAMVLHSDGLTQTLDTVWNMCGKKNLAGYVYQREGVAWMAGIDAREGDTPAIKPIPSENKCVLITHDEGKP